MTDNPAAIPADALPVLDHGFIRLVDSMGDDAAIVQAARTSYGEGTKTPSDDRSLIRYLMRHWHSTPFEMVEFKFHMRLPVFVARQWIRHRTANVNEYSARYSIVPELFYVPEPGRIGAQSATNKQGTGEKLDSSIAEIWQNMVRVNSKNAYEHYQRDIATEGCGAFGISRELARINLPQNAYTEWYWKCDLHNIFHLLRLRADAHAQWEIQQYAQALISLIRPIVPVALEAWQDYRQHAVNFSAQEMVVIRRMMAGGPIQLFGPEMSNREWIEFGEKMGVKK